MAERIGQPELLQRAQQRRRDAALHDDADVIKLTIRLAGVVFVQAMLDDVAARSRQALVDLQFFVTEGRWRMREPFRPTKIHSVEIPNVAPPKTRISASNWLVSSPAALAQK